MKTKKSSSTPKKTAPATKPAAKSTRTSARPMARIKAAAESAVARIKSAVSRKKSAPTPAAKSVTKPAIKIPPLLLEGDAPSSTSASGPGEKFALGPTSPERHFTQATELPEAYGTGRLFIAARDPHWLYANWDFTPAQLRAHNSKSVDHHLILRIYADKAEGKPVSETHVHPESNHWFVHVERAGTRYIAEIGYYMKGRRWNSLGFSGPSATPRDSASGDASFSTTTIPIEVPFKRLVAMVRDATRSNLPLALSIEALRAAGHPQLPESPRSTRWTAEQEHALTEIITVDQLRRVWIGSMEITELIRGRLERELSSIGASSLSLPWSGELSSPSGGPPPGEKGFWFNINAELIIYGSTEPDAHVSIGGRPIKLRADGSFSCRFSLPDGRYDLPIVAVSADETDGRAAELKFSRATEYRGDVGTYPQDPSLKPPTPENV